MGPSAASSGTDCNRATASAAVAALDAGVAAGAADVCCCLPCAAAFGAGGAAFGTESCAGFDS